MNPLNISKQMCYDLSLPRLAQRVRIHEAVKPNHVAKNRVLKDTDHNKEGFSLRASSARTRHGDHLNRGSVGAAPTPEES
jgi:hypothetical protein